MLCTTNARISYKQSSALRIKISSNNALRTLSAISCRKWTHHWIVCCVRGYACIYIWIKLHHHCLHACIVLCSTFHTLISNDPHDLTSVVSRSSRLGVWTDMVALNNSGANDYITRRRDCPVFLCTTDPTLGMWWGPESGVRSPESRLYSKMCSVWTYLILLCGGC